MQIALPVVIATLVMSLAHAVPPSAKDPEAQALLRAIYEHPDDDAPRLVYADWLQEHGNEERARFIRMQVESARLPLQHPRQHELRSLRFKRLHIPPILFELAAEGQTAWPWQRFYRRGFTEVATVSTRSIGTNTIKNLFHDHPFLSSIEIRGPYTERATEAFEEVPMEDRARLRFLQLEMVFVRTEISDLERILKLTPNLEELYIGGAEGPVEVHVRAIRSAECAPKLRVLKVYADFWMAPPLRQLFGGVPRFTALTDLSIWGGDLDDLSFLTKKIVPKLASLDFAVSTRISLNALRDFARTDLFLQLHGLGVGSQLNTEVDGQRLDKIVAARPHQLFYVGNGVRVVHEPLGKQIHKNRESALCASRLSALVQ